jgi:hypothetical protein
MLAGKARQQGTNPRRHSLPIRHHCAVMSRVHGDDEIDVAEFIHRIVGV